MCVAPIPLKQDGNKFAANKPFALGNSDVINVPCGKCVECRRTYVNSWVFRLTNEFKSKKTRSAYFLTLTFNDDYLYDVGNGLITLDGLHNINYRIFQLFMKRLRKSYGNGKSNIKYFAVGEYGDKSDRPHFHSIIFNVDQQNVLDAWNCGNVHFGEVTEASIKYTLKYAMKRVGRVYKKDWKEPEKVREIERSLCSRGLGLDYIKNKNVVKFYKNDITKQVLKEGGLVQPLPRYYREKIYTEAELLARSRLAQKAMDAQYSEENLRERQTLSVRKYQKETIDQKKRKNTGY